MNAHAPEMNKLAAPGAHTSSRPLASLLLTAGVSTLVVLADHWMAAWAEHHEVGAWLALWAVAVLAIVLLRGLSRRLARQVTTALDQWSARLAQRRADERLWDMARSDPRLMTELQCAVSRIEEGPEENITERAQHRVARLLRDRMYYI